VLFDSDETFLEHFDELGFDKSPVLIKLGRYEEAADLRLQDGKTIDAIQLYMQGNSEASREKACDVLLEEWWRILPFRSTTPNPSPTIEELSRLSDRVESPKAAWKDEVGLSMLITETDFSADCDLPRYCKERPSPFNGFKPKTDGGRERPPRTSRVLPRVPGVPRDRGIRHAPDALSSQSPLPLRGSPAVHIGHGRVRIRFFKSISGLQNHGRWLIP